NVLLILNDVVGGKSTTPSDIASKAGLSKGTISALLDSLEREELLTRVMSEEDRRSIHVQITRKGKDAVKKARAGFFSCISKMLNVLDNKQQNELVSIANKLQDSFNPSASPKKNARKSKK